MGKDKDTKQKSWKGVASKERPKRVGTYNEVHGDLIKMAKAGDFEYIGHGCNCYATMGAGIALPIGIQFPNAKQADKDFEAPSFMRLGNFSVGKERTTAGAMLKVVNFYSQYWGGKNFDKEALILSLRKFNLYLSDTDGVLPSRVRIGLPIIGCGIAGGDWNEVRLIIQKELSQFDVTIVHYKEEK